MMNQLAKWIKEKHTSVHIGMHPRHQFVVVAKTCPELISSSSVAEFEFWTDLGLVHAPRFASLCIDPNTAFAAANKLDLYFSIYVPLSSQITAWDADQDLAAQHVVGEAGPDGKTFRWTNDDDTLYVTTDSEQKCRWLLFPKCHCHAASGFCGFQPEFLGIAQCCCQHSQPSE